MADPQIVSCPGCGKRYSVPSGAAPGQFQCQDCSSVVVYGRSAPPAGAQGHGHGTSARTHAKAAAAKRKLARNRHADEEEDEDRPGQGHGHGGKKKQDASVYLMGIVGIVVLIGAAAFLFSKTKSDKPKVVAGPRTAEPSGMGKFVPEEETAPAPAPKAPPPLRSAAPVEEPPKPSEGMKAAIRGGVSDKPDVFTPAANPPTGSNYGKSQAGLLAMLRDNRSEVWVDPGHLPDTPSDLAQKIDADIAKMADVNGGSEFLRAQDRLIKIGRPAIPRVVGLTSKLDFTKYSNMVDARDACALGDAIDNVLRGITGYDKVHQLQYSPQNGKITEYMESLDEWCLWWFTIGYKRETFYKASGAAEDEKL